MSFSVQLSPDVIPCEPGSSTPVSVVITNKGTEADRFEMEVEGIDPDWKAVPVAVFGVDPGEPQTEKVFLKPPRSSESGAGNYPFVVRVRSLETGESKTVQGVAQVKPFHHISMEVNPRKGFYFPMRKQNIFDVTLVNLGNTSHTLKLNANDPEDACTYAFDEENTTLSPGQQRDVELTVTPTTSRILSNSRLIGFSITSRSIDVSSVSASSQAQLEQRPLLTVGTIVFFLILASTFGLWLYFLPKPPTLEVHAVPRQIVAGGQITITWNSEHARMVRIRVGEQQIYEGPDLVGNRTVTLKEAGVTTILAEASYNSDRKKTSTLQIQVDPAPIAPKPIIENLTFEPAKIRLGEPFVIHYKFGGEVSSAVLQPSGAILDTALSDREVTPTRAGKLTYTVVARNSEGHQVTKSFDVFVVDESDAKILAFQPSTKLVRLIDGKVTFTWQVTGAERVEIKPSGQGSVAVDSTGSLDFPLSTKTEFVLTAFDSKGRRTNAKSVVDIEQAPKPAVPKPDAGTDPANGNTSGTTGGTPPPAPGTSTTSGAGTASDGTQPPAKTTGGNH